ncbi:hypothetical protein KKG81_01665 [bacterium]|jgi:hypothetical protein|nr:hypothetical protein [bacterium]
MKHNKKIEKTLKLIMSIVASLIITISPLIVNTKSISIVNNINIYN